MTIQTVDAKTLKNWLDMGEAVLVDVREPAEHAAEKIDGAHLVPLSSLDISAFPQSHGKKLVLHCRKGGRGGNACAKLLESNPALEVYNLEGGITAWAGQGLPITKSKSTVLPVDQQVQLVIGTCVLTGSLLGFFLAPIFFILSAFFGAGLIFAALTGTCTLGVMIAKMPWNR